MKKNYKSILGLNTVKAFIVVLLSLAIVAVVFLIVLGSIISSNIVPAGSQTAIVTNEVGWINQSGYTLTNAGVQGFVSPTITSITNRTDGTIIVAVNYTVSGTGLLTNSTVRNWNTVNINYTYNYDSSQKQGVNSIVGNSSAGVVNFFTNSSTYFALLGVVVIILIISLVVVVVNRFGGGTAQGESPGL